MQRTAALLGLLLCTSAWAQPRAGDALVSDAPVNEAPRQAAPHVELTEDGDLRAGAVTLTPREYFVRAGHDALVARSDHNLLVRKWLIASGVVVFVATLVLGSVVLAITPNGEKPYCTSSVPRYNECLDYINLYNHGGAAIIGGGAVLAGLLAAIGWFHRPEVLSRADLAALVKADEAHR
jgi:hypothetical protein